MSSAANPWLKDINDARASASTVVTIQLLLHSDNVKTFQDHLKEPGKDVIRVKKSRGLATATGAVKKITGRGKKGAKEEAVIVQDESLKALSVQEKLILATETVNATLKSLSQSLKNQPKGNKTKSPSKPSSNESITATVAQTPTAKSKRALKPTSPNVGRVQAPMEKATENSLLESIPATAECARIAFAYLRMHQKEGDNKSHDYQLENGMLALIGKCIGLGLLSIAVKELRIVKGRLDGYIGQTQINGNTKHAAEGQEKDSYAGLLVFGRLPDHPSLISVVSSHQLHVLKIMAAHKKPALIEASVSHLQLSSPCSPINLLASQESTAESKIKAARQLESLAQILFSLCPSVATTDDSSANNARVSIAPDSAFQIQILAFRTRLIWWQLAGHEPAVEKELWAPFSKCLVTFSRRAVQESSANYSLAKESLTQLDTALSKFVKTAKTASATTEDSPSRKAVLRALSQLAQAAGEIVEAMEWMSSLPTDNGNTSAAESASCTIRLATLGLRSNNGEKLLDDAIRALAGSLKGDSSTVDRLLADVMSLRKAASSLYVEHTTSKKMGELSSLGKLCCDTIFGCTRFLIRYLGQAPSTGVDSSSITRYYERVKLARKVLKSFLESTLHCVKSRVQRADLEFNKIELVLQDCCHLITELPNAEKSDDNAYDFHQNLQFPLVTISSLYYILYQQQATAPGTSRSAGIKPLRRSIDMLRDRTAVEKDKGLFSVKLDRLADLYSSSGHPKEAHRALEASLREHVEAGHLHAAAEASASYSLAEIASGEGSASLMVRVLKQYEQIAIKFVSAEARGPGFFDDANLLREERGLLLEWQLGFASQTLNRSRNNDHELLDRIHKLTHLLLDIYTPEEYPIRRLRVVAVVSRIMAEHSALVDSSIIEQVDTLLKIAHVSPLGQDAGLQKYRLNLLAILRAGKALRSSPVDLKELEKALLDWQILIDSCNTTKALLDCIDDINSWVAQVSVLADYLHMQGIYNLLFPTLHLLAKVLELKPDRDTSDVLKAQCMLARVHLKLGYSGKAGRFLAKAEPILEQPYVHVEAALGFHLVYAEYLLEIGNIDKCGEALRKAQELGMYSEELRNLSGPASTLSTRTKVSRLMADACLVYSKYNLESGFSDDAFRFARDGVKLNQRVWMSLESKMAPTPAPTQAGTDTEMDSLSRSMGTLNTSTSRPLVVSSMTHEALSGPAFWSLVPSLYRSYVHLSSVFAHHGMVSEAVHYAERAKKITTAVNSPPCMVEVATHIANLYLKTGNVDEAVKSLAEVSELVEGLKDSQEVVRYKLVVSSVCCVQVRFEEGLKCLEDAQVVLDRLLASDHVAGLQKIASGEDQLADTLATLSIQAKPPPKTPRGRKPAAPKAPARTARKAPPPKAAAKSNEAVEECIPLLALTGEVLRAKTMALYPHQTNGTATQALLKIQQFAHPRAIIENAVLKARLLLSAMEEQLASNLTFSALLESTIALPALCHTEKVSSIDIASVVSPVAPIRKAPTKTPKKATSRNAVTGREVAVQNFAATLQEARDVLSMVKSQVLRVASTSTIHKLFGLLGSNSVLLSAAGHIHPKGMMHPLQAAFYLDVARLRVTHLEQSITQVENVATTKEKLLQWPSVESTRELDDSATLNALQLQNDYIDILPAPWTAISISLNDAKDEFLLTRYRAKQSPFILRLPMARHQSRDLDEETFDFLAGKKEMLEIISLANFSAHDARNLSVKGGKTQWWAEREAVDKRLADFLVNMENLWLGGFRGIFAENHRESHALARFQRELQNSLGRHLPSRQGKGVAKPLVFDSRILELFTGLGDPDSEGVDLDEPLMDLMYFIVDILQFNGEENAVDEIDFDSIVIEMVDALRNYHSETAGEKLQDQHTILILDKNLHIFPWESLPSLRTQSISRLPSLTHLRQRIPAMNSSKDDNTSDTSSSSSTQSSTPEGYQVSRTSGASILNPSGDLTNTQKKLQPLLHSLPQSWTHTTTPSPTETQFSSLLTSHSILLYFGHGSGAQYIRPRAVKKLASKPSQAPTTWLMGCSSAAVTECGEFEPYGMVLAYLAAGAPAVVGTLWDVTDKDCDRAAVKTGEVWGLWDKVSVECRDVRRKGKGKVPVEVEKVRGGKVAERRKMFEQSENGGNGGGNGEERSGSEEGRRGNGMGKSLVQAVVEGRDETYLRFLNGAALVVYGVPVYVGD
ncbi:hypothetical protein EJ08DRAFT_615949 [Tothia fuscella]|uniref:separase n=1 Tax=Tothia fuscella TaxID=1048955 RepID=A0A9P4NMK4_9PEZI|nr:hypothetical protein EJ08DRAFT_615949 [Tothia fuscella]